MLLEPQIKKLDKVLSVINSSEPPYRENRDELHARLNKHHKDYGITFQDVTLIIDKLEKDGYIYGQHFGEDCYPCYFMNYDGLSFENDGGYKKASTLWRKIVKSIDNYKNIILISLATFGSLLSLYTILNSNTSNVKINELEHKINILEFKNTMLLQRLERSDTTITLLPPKPLVKTIN